MPSLIPMRPKGQKFNLTVEEMDGLTYFVLSGCQREVAFLKFIRPDFIASKTSAAVKSAVSQFFANKEVKDYLEAYKKTIEDLLAEKDKPKPERSGTMEERKAKAKAKAMEFAMDLADHIEEAQDPEFVMKMLDKVGILDSGEEVEVAPQRFLAERCSDCRYRVFCEQECEDLCQYCRYRTFGEESGVHYENKDMLDMPNKIGTKIEEENKNE